jgi:hypothetical protein
MSNRPRSFYPGGLTDTPISYWDMWVPFLQSLGINSDNAPRFAPPATPPQDSSPGRYQVPANGIASNGTQPQLSPAALTQAGLTLAQLGQPTQPTWMAQQQPQGLLSPQIAANTTADPQSLRGLLGLLDSNSWSR